jgi:hypothetical protein
VTTPTAWPDAGPYETPYDTAKAAAWVTASVHSPPVRKHRLLCEALTAAGVELGAFDHDAVLWLAGLDPFTVAVLRGLILRAFEAGRAAMFGDLEPVRAALADAVRYRGCGCVTLSCPGCTNAVACPGHAREDERAAVYSQLLNRLRPIGRPGV